MSVFFCDDKNIIIPQHIAIIMDGNGRWAKNKNLPRTAGHKKGADSVKTAIEAACETGVSCLTLFAFSSENWLRPQKEVATLMRLLKNYLKKEVPKLHKKNIRLSFIGSRLKLDNDIAQLMNNAEKLTINNQKLHLIIAISYGSREEIIDAVKDVAKDVMAGKILFDEITEEEFSKRLWTKDIPNPDLLIRTSGEKRISNFLLWQIAYSELVFIDTLWPDFTKEDFFNAIAEYSKRERRYGKTTAV